jgi:hypothetical protein
MRPSGSDSRAIPDSGRDCGRRWFDKVPRMTKDLMLLACLESGPHFTRP